MKEQLLSFLLYQREELKKENIYMYLRLMASGKLFVGFEYYYPYIDWEGKPKKVSEKRCNLNVSFDDLTPQKYEKFMKSYERILGEVRESQKNAKDEFKTVEFSFQAVMKDFEQN
jgi:hypothetical protein